MFIYDENTQKNATLSESLLLRGVIHIKLYLLHILWTYLGIYSDGLLRVYNLSSLALLLQVVMSIHKTRCYYTSACIYNIISFLLRKIRSNFLNSISIDFYIHISFVWFIIGCKKAVNILI